MTGSRIGEASCDRFCQPVGRQVWMLQGTLGNGWFWRQVFDNMTVKYFQALC